MLVEISSMAERGSAIGIAKEKADLSAVNMAGVKQPAPSHRSKSRLVVFAQEVCPTRWREMLKVASQTFGAFAGHSSSTVLISTYCRYH